VVRSQANTQKAAMWFQVAVRLLWDESEGKGVVGGKINKPTFEDLRNLYEHCDRAHRAT
jgi:hypothetical protein